MLLIKIFDFVSNVAINVAPLIHMVKVRPVQRTVNLSDIDSRLQQLWDFDSATKYAKQKDSLQKELESFL